MCGSCSAKTCTLVFLKYFNFVWIRYIVLDPSSICVMRLLQFSVAKLMSPLEGMACRTVWGLAPHLNDVSDSFCAPGLLLRTDAMSRCISRLVL